MRVLTNTVLLRISFTFFYSSLLMFYIIILLYSSVARFMFKKCLFMVHSVVMVICILKRTIKNYLIN